MIVQCVAIRDQAIDSFMRPAFYNHLGQAIRQFIDEMNDKTSELSKHPEHFDLYHLGNYDDSTGQFTNLIPKPLLLTVGAQITNREDNDVQK